MVLPTGYTTNRINSLVDAGGAPRCPIGSQFFYFEMHFLQNVAALGVSALLWGWGPLWGCHPPTGNPGSATATGKLSKLKGSFLHVPRPPCPRHFLPKFLKSNTHPKNAKSDISLFLPWVDGWGGSPLFLMFMPKILNQAIRRIWEKADLAF